MIFKKYENVIICPIPENSELDRTQIERIVTHTHNTWQHDRPVAEIRANTIQGKKAEIVIEKLLAENSAARYLSYDKLRNDNFEMHAPFDGLIYNCSTGKNRLNEVVRTINNDVKNSVGDTGMLKPETREFLEDNGFYTIEIKSSLLQNPRDYRNMTHKNRTDRTREDYICLCDHIKEFYDFFVYPHYCRDNINICSFYDYTVYVRGKNPEFRNCSIENFIIKLMRDEYRNIVHMKDGTDWIIETKGGETHGYTKNIDTQVANKFVAFKQYAEAHNLKWGFVRDMEEELYINNTEYHEEIMGCDNWEPLKNQF